MRGLVVYDTYYGNTKKLAEIIFELAKGEGHEMELRSVREDYPMPPQGDFMFIGSPVRFGSVSGKTKRFVKKLDVSAWKEKPIAVFTTVGPLPKEGASDKEKMSCEKWVWPAARKLRDMARERGLNSAEKVLYAGVKDGKGPLDDNVPDLARQFAQEFLASLKK